MEWVKQIGLSTLCGMKDFFVGISRLLKILIAKSEPDSRRERTQHRTSSGQTGSVSTVKEKVYRCIVFGIIFYLSNFIFNRLFVQYVFAYIVYLFGEEMDSSFVVGLQPYVYALFFCTWICPVFLISKILNFFWYQKIADSIFVSSGLRRNTTMRVSDFVAEVFKSFILQIIYCIQGCVLYLCPIPFVIQTMWYVFHLALLTSLYAFEYKWVHLGLPLPTRLLKINRRWPYFLGFGLPLALITTFTTPFINSMIVFATLFPLCVVSSAFASENKSHLCIHPINTFRFSDFGAEIVIKLSLSLPVALLSLFHR